MWSRGEKGEKVEKKRERRIKEGRMKKVVVWVSDPLLLLGKTKRRMIGWLIVRGRRLFASW